MPAQLPEVREYNGGYARIEWLPDNRPERLNPVTKSWEPTPQGAVVQVITKFGRTHEDVGFQAVTLAGLTALIPIAAPSSKP